MGIFRQQSLPGENTATETTHQPDNEEFQGPVSVLLGTNLLCSLGIIILSSKMKATGKMVWVLFQGCILQEGLVIALLSESLPLKTGYMSGRL